MIKIDNKKGREKKSERKFFLKKKKKKKKKIVSKSLQSLLAKIQVGRVVD